MWPRVDIDLIELEVRKEIIRKVIQRQGSVKLQCFYCGRLFANRNGLGQHTYMKHSEESKKTRTYPDELTPPAGYTGTAKRFRKTVWARMRKEKMKKENPERWA